MLALLAQNIISTVGGVVKRLYIKVLKDWTAI